MAGTHNLTITYGLRYEYYPIPTRDHRGLESYDSRKIKSSSVALARCRRIWAFRIILDLFSPRVGHRLPPDAEMGGPHRLRHQCRPVFAGAAFPDQLPGACRSELRRAQHLRVCWPDRGRHSAGSGAVAGNGIIAIPGTVSAKTLDTNFRRGYVESFNFTVAARDHPGPFRPGRVCGNTWHPPAGQPGTELGADRHGQYGTGSESAVRTRGKHADAGAVLEQRTTTRCRPISNRRFGAGFSAQASYTFSKAIAYADESDSTLAFNIPSSFRRDRSVTGYDRTHNFQTGFIVESPFGKERSGSELVRVITCSADGSSTVHSARTAALLSA